MKSDDIIMKAAIIHILDSSVGIPVLSDRRWKSALIFQIS